MRRHKAALKTCYHRLRAAIDGHFDGLAATDVEDAIALVLRSFDPDEVVYEKLYMTCADVASLHQSGDLPHAVTRFCVQMVYDSLHVLEHTSFAPIFYQHSHEIAPLLLRSLVRDAFQFGSGMPPRDHHLRALQRAIEACEDADDPRLAAAAIDLHVHWAARCRKISPRYIDHFCEDVVRLCTSPRPPPKPPRRGRYLASSPIPITKRKPPRSSAVAHSI